MRNKKDAEMASKSEQSSQFDVFSQDDKAVERGTEKDFPLKANAEKPEINGVTLSKENPTNLEGPNAMPLERGDAEAKSDNKLKKEENEEVKMVDENSRKHECWICKIFKRKRKRSQYYVMTQALETLEDRVKKIQDAIEKDKEGQLLQLLNENVQSLNEEVTRYRQRVLLCDDMVKIIKEKVEYIIKKIDDCEYKAPQPFDGDRFDKIIDITTNGLKELENITENNFYMSKQILMETKKLAYETEEQILKAIGGMQEEINIGLESIEKMRNEIDSRLGSIEGTTLDLTKDFSQGYARWWYKVGTSSYALLGDIKKIAQGAIEDDNATLAKRANKEIFEQINAFLRKVKDENPRGGTENV